MKKTILALAAFCLSLTGFAQTNFRNITFEEAVAAAKAEKKLVFIDFYATWCMPCKRMAVEVFPQPAVGEYMNETFVSLKIDAEKEGKELAVTYGVQAYPTFVVVDTDRKEVARIVGSKKADEFVADMKRMLNPETSAENLAARYNRGERNGRLIQDYANSLMEGVSDRAEFEKAAAKAFGIVQDYFSSLSDEERVKEENLFVFRNYSTMLEVPSAKFMAQHLDKFPASAKAEMTAMVKDLYDKEVYAYFTGSTEMNVNKLNDLKKEIEAAKLNENHQYDLPYKFIDAYMAGSRSTYLDFCAKNFKKLSPTQQALLVNGFIRLFYREGKDVKLKAAKFLRSQLADLDANSLYYAALQIGELEK